MTDKRTQASADSGNMEKDPDDWVTGDEPMTGAQKSYLKTLSEEARIDFDENLTKAEASRGEGRTTARAPIRAVPGPQATRRRSRSGPERDSAVLTGPRQPGRPSRRGRISVGA